MRDGIQGSNVFLSPVIVLEWCLPNDWLNMQNLVLRRGLSGLTLYSSCLIFEHGSLCFCFLLDDMKHLVTVGWTDLLHRATGRDGARPSSGLSGSLSDVCTCRVNMLNGGWDLSWCLWMSEAVGESSPSVPSPAATWHEKELLWKKERGIRGEQGTQERVGNTGNELEYRLMTHVCEEAIMKATCMLTS